MSRKIVFATFGSLGDLHPLMAVALELKARGHEPVFAVPPDNAAKIERAGFETRLIFPSMGEIGAMIGGDAGTVASLMRSDMDFMIRRVLLKLAPDTVARLISTAEGAAAIVAPSFFAPIAIAADKLRMPLVTAVFQPLMMFSAHDAPRSPDLPMFVSGRARGMSLAWNRAVMPVVFAEMHRRYSPRVNKLRRMLGLPPTDHAPVFGIPKSAALVLGLYSPAFAPPPPDLPKKTVVTGFTFYDSADGAPDALDAETEAFLSAGDPPLVFTLGSFAIHAPGAFYETSLAIARQLGRRALLLTGGPHALPSAPDVLVRAYLPHSLVFPRALAIVHHGGMGSTGQALRAGKPQLVVPHFGDQFDNASRLARLGVARKVDAKRYSAEGQRSLAALLSDAAASARAQSIAKQVRMENSAATAATAIERVLA